MNSTIKTLFTSVFMLSALSTAALADTYVVGQDMHNLNSVGFHSTATLASFTGTTDKVEGTANVDLKNLKASTGEIKVHLDSLNTGIEKRNEHMRGLLNTDKNSLAVFKLKKLNTPLKTLPAYKTVAVNATGDLTIGSVTKPVTTIVNFTYMPEKDKDYRQGNWIQMATDFNIKLSDFGIKAPGVIPMKVNDTVKIMVDVMGQKK